MKKQGSMLIEVVAAVMILMVTSTFIMSINIENYNKIKERKFKNHLNMAINSIENEFKYNLSKNNIEEILEKNEIGFKYDENLNYKLTYEQIENLEAGSDILIKKIYENDTSIKMKIESNFDKGSKFVNIEKEFVKSWWMDEV